jgi:hypothetical protein
MRINRFFSATAAIATLLAGSASFAADAPQQLRGKTISASYFISAPATNELGQAVDARRHDSFTVYISGPGRIFARGRAAGSSLQRSADFQFGRWQFSNSSTLQTTFVTTSGATQLRISFDSGYSTCAVSVIRGREGDKPHKWAGVLSKHTYTSAGPATFSEMSCSISEGNML